MDLILANPIVLACHWARVWGFWHKRRCIALYSKSVAILVLQHVKFYRMVSEIHTQVYILSIHIGIHMQTITCPHQQSLCPKSVLWSLSPLLCSHSSGRTINLTHSGHWSSQHMVSVCLGTACHVKGGGRILERLERDLKISSGETTKDKLFSLEAVRCLGCCSIAPVMRIGDVTYGRLKQDNIPRILESYA